MSLKVLYSFPHPLGGPGIGTTALNQVLGLAELGVDVEVWCTSAARALPASVQVRSTLVLGGRRVPHRLVGVERAYRLHDRAVARRLRTGPRPDLVHTWPASCLRTLELARQQGVPGFREVPSVHTATAYELAARESARTGVSLPRNHSHRFDRRRLDRELREFEAADVLLVPSAFVEASFLERGTPAHRLSRHRYGCDTGVFFPRGRRDDPASFVFMGRGEPGKGLHFALEAWQRAGLGERGYRFLLAGSILDGFARRYHDLLRQPGIEQLGFVTDVPMLLCRATALVLPSVSEGSALVTFEAMASGCIPIVSTACGAPCDHSVDGLVHQPGEVDELAGHLRSVAADEVLRARLSAACLARRESLDWSAAARDLLDAYRSRL